jgi:DNA-binding CsgD family transcriptional regulator
MKKKNEKNNNEPLMGKLAEEWQEILWNNVLTGLLRTKSKRELKEIIESLLTEDEKNMILRRLAATALIRQGKSYKEIGEILWISSASISAIKKGLFSKTPHHKSHKLIYQHKNQLSVPYNPPKESFSQSVVNFITELIDNVERELSRNGLSLVSYSRSIHSKNKK